MSGGFIPRVGRGKMGAWGGKMGRRVEDGDAHNEVIVVAAVKHDGVTQPRTIIQVPSWIPEF